MLAKIDVLQYFAPFEIYYGSMVKRLQQFAEGFRWRGNIYVALGLYLLLMMALYMICRIGFYFYNAEFFPDMTLARFGKIMGGGLRFDLSAILYLNSCSCCC